MPKVLIVDDDTDLVEAMKIVLESRGYAVDCAYEGESGFKKARTGRPDLIILDVMMKTKDQGFQISYRLKNDPELSRIPILLLTGVARETGFTFGREDEDYLVTDELAEKPLKPAKLLSTVERLIKKGGAKTGTQRS
ncbi:MAG: response regulator [Deltaproteobacteria bacterium]|nr:response regulator [Deltaproteobacteria bacterium]